MNDELRQLHPAVWLPRMAKGGALDLEKVEVGGRPLQATGLHERVTELLTSVGTSMPIHDWTRVEAGILLS